MVCFRRREGQPGERESDEERFYFRVFDGEREPKMLRLLFILSTTGRENDSLSLSFPLSLSLSQSKREGESSLMLLRGWQALARDRDRDGSDNGREGDREKQRERERNLPILLIELQRRLAFLFHSSWVVSF